MQGKNLLRSQAEFGMLEQEIFSKFKLSLSNRDEIDIPTQFTAYLDRIEEVLYASNLEREYVNSEFKQVIQKRILYFDQILNRQLQ